MSVDLHGYEYDPSSWSSFSSTATSLDCPPLSSSYVKNNRGFLTSEECAFYDKNGFILIKGLIPQSDIDVYNQRFLEIAEGKAKDAPPFMLKMRDVAIAKQKDKKQDDESTITKLQDWQDDEILFSYCKHPKILPYVESIIGTSIRSVHTMLINKPPDVGVGSSRHPPHQDLWYFPFRPSDLIVASWTAMQNINKENGCLFVAPGTHKMGKLFHHEYPQDGIVNKAYHGIQNISGESSSQSHSLFHVIMEPGDTLFFHPLLIHGSGRNNSKGYRKAISCHYASSECHFIDVSLTIQKEIEEEVIEMARKRGKKDHVNWVSIWQKKSKIILGEKNAQKFDHHYNFAQIHQNHQGEKKDSSTDATAKPTKSKL